jgi:hypothetical protein
MDIERKVYSWYEQILFITLTVIAFISIYFGVQYLFVISSISLVRIDLNDNFQLFELDSHEDNSQTYYVDTERTESEIDTIMSILLDLYETNIITSRNNLEQSIYMAIGKKAEPPYIIKEYET